MNPSKGTTTDNRYKNNHKYPPSKQTSSLTDREWSDHKYIDKVQTKTGKIRYIYELPSGTRISYDEYSPQNAKAMWGRDDNRQRYADKEFTKNMDTHEKHLANNLKKGRFNNAVQDVKNIVNEVTEDPYTALHVVGEATNNAIKNAQKTVQDGLNKVNDFLNSAIASTPLKDLFK